jgi:hypothetical protein
VKGLKFVNDFPGKQITKSLNKFMPNKLIMDLASLYGNAWWKNYNKNNYDW